MNNNYIHVFITTFSISNKTYNKNGIILLTEKLSRARTISNVKTNIFYLPYSHISRIEKIFAKICPKLQKNLIVLMMYSSWHVEIS